MKNGFVKYKLIVAVFALCSMVMFAACSKDADSTVMDEPVGVVDLNLGGGTDDSGLAEDDAADDGIPGADAVPEDDGNVASGENTGAPDDGRTYVASDKDVQNMINHTDG